MVVRSTSPRGISVVLPSHWKARFSVSLVRNFQLSCFAWVQHLNPSIAEKYTLKKNKSKQ